MGPDEIEWIMRQSTWSLEVEGQHPDAQTMEWCHQMLAGWRDFVGGISRFGDSSGNGIVSTLRDLCTGVFPVIFDYCGAVFALGFLV